MHTNTLFSFFFFFNDTATTEIYTLSLHDALPISHEPQPQLGGLPGTVARRCGVRVTCGKSHSCTRALAVPAADRKSTRLNSSHGYISYAVFCLKKKKNYTVTMTQWIDNSHRTKPH